VTGLLLAVLPLLDPGTWTAAPSDGVSAVVAEDQGTLRLDVDFHGGGGYAVIRRNVNLDLPENYALSFRVRGTVPANNLEVKLIDGSGDNVWWRNLRDFAFGREWRTVRIKKRQITFAWGPNRSEHPAHVAALELAVTAGQGGKGSVWFDSLSLTELPPDAPDAGKPSLSATSSDPEHPLSAAMDGDGKTFWRSGPPGPEGETLTLDFGVPREFGGLALDWEGDEVARTYTVELSLDGREWTQARRVVATNGGRDWIATPEAEARLVRLVLQQPWNERHFALREIGVLPLAFSETPNAFVEAIAKEEPRGLYPRSFSGEQVYWTVVGEDGAAEEALLSEDGAVEVGQGSFSIEPFLYTEDGFKSWADVATTHTLANDSLPIPTVTWRAGDVRLDVTPWVVNGRLFAKYRVSSLSGKRHAVTLALVIRPFQVNPPSQFLNGPGGVAPIRTVKWEGEDLVVNGDRHVRRLDGGDWISAPFDAASPGEFARGVCRGGGSEWRWGVVKEDPTGLASASTVAKGTVRKGSDLLVVLEAPLRSDVEPGPAVPVEDALASWRSKLGGYALRLPPQAKAIADTVRSNLAYILINRDGPAIQPGSRAYRRSWIRDGSLTSSALARLGHAEEAKAFVRWFAPYQYPDGKVPCCVDWRGADPVPENDSHGELIFAIAEVWRYTKDRNFLEEMFPHVEKAVAYMDRLRESQRLRDFRSPEDGLLPESISHEGYSDKPVHSYWDDFFALRGYKDAVTIAEALGRADAVERFTRSRDAFRQALGASVRLTMELNAIDYVPGSVEHHDFDATSTTIALEPADAADDLPPGALERTFQRYWEEFVARREGTTWDAYTPYEWRTVGAMVRLGWKDRAHEAIAWFLSHRRPPGWNQWAEVVAREERKPRFLGDMPHTWCGSDFIRSILDLFWYEEGDALVVGAGIPEVWARAEGGVGATLLTPYGTLDFQVAQKGSAVGIELRGGLVPPAGGILLRSPSSAPIRSARVNGAAVRPEKDGSIRLHATPARVEIRHGL